VGYSCAPLRPSNLNCHIHCSGMFVLNSCSTGSFCSPSRLHLRFERQDMINTSAQFGAGDSLLERTFSPRMTIDKKLTVTTPKIYSENKIAELAELFHSLSELVDGFVRLARTSELPFGKPENPHQWNIFECTDAILSLVGAHRRVQFQPSLDNYPNCDCNSRQTMMTGPCALCLGVRSSLLTKNCCSQVGT
jgi:hypothetical protein